MKISSTKGGKARKVSTQARSGQRTQGDGKVERMARIMPPSSPSGTTMAESSKVARKPAHKIGEASFTMSQFRKAERKSSMLSASRRSGFQSSAP